MNTKIVLDSRESALQSICISKNIDFNTKQLDLGDIIILASSGKIDTEGIVKSESNAAQKLLLHVPPRATNFSSPSIPEVSESSSQSSNEPDRAQTATIVIERKTFTDLKASIADGRYREQKSRYTKLPKGTMFYILENNDPNFEQLDYKAWLGMYIHTVIRDQISVLISRSPEETVDFIVKIAKTVNEFGLPAINCMAELPAPKESQIKKKKLYGKDVYVAQLCCINGISTAKAKKIAEKYTNMEELIEALRGEDTFQVAGIGPTLKNSLYDGLL